MSGAGSWDVGVWYVVNFDDIVLDNLRVLDEGTMGGPIKVRKCFGSLNTWTMTFK
jgi:hypothetical protein